MTKASDNAYPSLLIRESADDGSDFSSPAADYRRFYIGEDGDLHLKDSSGTVTDFPVGGGSGAPTDAQYVVATANGTLSAERVVTVPATGGAIPLLIRKSANETVNGSAALQDDNHLLFAIGASEVWEFEAVLWYSSGTTPDLKVAFTVPASAEIYVGWGGSTSEADAALGGGVIVGSGTARGLQGGGASATPNRVATAKGLVVNSTNAGNVQMQWAQNTSNGSDTIIFANSTLKAYKLA